MSKQKTKPDPAILKICLKNKMQKMVNRKGTSVNKVTIEFGDNPPVIIAEKKPK